MLAVVSRASELLIRYYLFTYARGGSGVRASLCGGVFSSSGFFVSEPVCDRVFKASKIERVSMLPVLCSFKHPFMERTSQTRTRFKLSFLASFCLQLIVWGAVLIKL